MRTNRREDKRLNAGYLRALAAAKQISGKDHGAASWLADELGTTRMLLFHWSKFGFPAHVIPTVCRVTGLPADDVTTVTVEMPESVWQRICDRMPKSVISQAVDRR